MELYERIALARKKAGLSQEQLGEKLGVSRQAVSKWESGQSNPDVSYVVAMCRLFGVSSDWLLLGEDVAQETAPVRCPNCQTIVTGLDKFCPNCGRKLVEEIDRNGKFDIILKRPGENKDRLIGALCQLYNDHAILPPECDINMLVTRGNVTSYDAKHIIDRAPSILCRNVPYENVEKIMELFRDWAVVWVYPSRGETLDNMLLREEPLSFSSGKDEAVGPMYQPSFGSTVAAVVVGVIVAILLLAIL